MEDVMKKPILALTLALAFVATPAAAYEEDKTANVTAQTVHDGTIGSSGGLIVPLILLAIIAAAASS